ncbi:hypothetical protein ACI7BZ_09340 [Xanthobacter sp. AM11]|uniref:hypothetical protein n=1 Tax=Xanthobacter sp. AM11 TaxID=3380643 RepID=UPI0039BF96F4
MSGPKVVRVITREEVQAICRREMAATQAAADALRRAHERYDQLSEQARQAIAEATNQLAALYKAEQYDEIRKLAPQLTAFFKAESERLVREAIAAAEAARSRRRRVADSARSVCAALEAAGKPVPAGLPDVPARAAAADEAGLAVLERTVEDSFRALVAPPRSADGMNAGAQALAERLSGEEAGRSYAQWLAERQPVPTPGDLRLDTALAAIEALGNMAMAERYAARSAEVQAAGPQRRALLLDSLLLDAARDARHLRDERELRTRLQEAAAELGALGTEPARVLAARIGTALAQIAAHEDAARFLADSQALLTEAVTEISKETSSIAAVARRRTVLGAFATLGYEVREGMATVWAREGQLVIRKPGTGDYGVELGAPADAARMQVRLVGSDRPSALRTATRDRDQEVLWCSEFERLKGILHTDGDAIAIDRALEAGAQAVKTVVFPDAEEQSERTEDRPPRVKVHRQRPKG